MRCDECNLQLYKGDEVAVDSKDRVMHAGCYYSLRGLTGGGGAKKARKAKTKRSSSNFLGTMAEEVVKGVMKGLQPQPQPQAQPSSGNTGGLPSMLATLAPMVSAALGGRN